MVKRSHPAEPESKRKVITAAVMAFVVILLILGAWFGSRIFPKTFFFVSRVKNAFSYYALKQKPHFYYLRIEKSGKEIRLGEEDVLEVTYRDEFAVKAVVSDDLNDRYISVTIEGTGNEGNHIGVLVRGVDLVNRIMHSGTVAKGAEAAGTYRIRIDYAGQKIAVVPIRVMIEPQDWLRVAGDAGAPGAQIEYLKNAIAKNSQDAGVRRILAGIYLRQNRTEEAAVLFADVLRIKPDDTGAMKDLAQCDLRNNRPDHAIEILNRLAGIQKQDAEVYAMLGLAYGNKKLWNQSAESFAQAVRMEPDHAERRLFLAQAYEKAGKTGAATEQYQYLAARAQDATSAWRALGDISLKQKNYDRAISYYRRILQKKPLDAAAYANLATAYAGQGKLKEEMEYLQKAVSLAPDDPVIHFNLAEAYEKRGRMDAAVKEYQLVLEKNPGDLDALEHLGDLMLRNKKYDQAVGYYEKIGPGLHEKASMFINRGFAYGEIRQYGKSAENYEKAIKMGVRDQTLYYNLAYTYTRLGRDKDAVVYYEKISPQTRQTLGMIADYYLKNRNYERAIQYYQRIVKLDPKKASSYFSIGCAYAAIKNYDRAISNYLAALKYDREDDETYASLGDAYEKKGLYAEALKAYKTAYEINPETRVAGRIPRLTIQLMQKSD